MTTEQQTQGQENTAPPTPENAAGQEQVQSPEGQTQESPQEFLERTGFKTLADAEKSYKEAQRKITEQGQKLSQFESALQGQYAQGQQQQTYAPPKGQGTDFFDDPEGHVVRLAEQIADRKVNGKIQELEAKQSITRVRSENPAKFDALRPIVQQVYIEKPFLNSMGEDGLRQAMEEAGTRRKSYLADLKAEMFPDESGENNPSDTKQQAKNEVLAEQERARQATIPQGGASRPISDDVKKQMDEMRQKGDVDGLIGMKIPEGF